MESVLTYVGPGTTKEEKENWLRDHWPRVMAKPRKFQPTFAQTDCQPIHGALDWSLLAYWAVENRPDLASFVGEYVGTLQIQCELRPPLAPLRGDRKQLIVGKAQVPPLAYVGLAKEPKLLEPSKQTVMGAVARALYAVDYHRLSKSKRKQYEDNCPASASPPIERYAREMEILVAPDWMIAFNSMAHRLNEEAAVHLAHRMKILSYSASAHGWIDFTL